MVVTDRIVADAQTNPSYSPGGANSWFFARIRESAPNDISICSVRFRGLTFMTNRQKDRQTDGQK